MKSKKFAVLFIISFLMLQSCSGTMLIDDTGCNFDIRKVKKIIKTKKIGNIKKLFIVQDSENKLNTKCDGLYYLSVVNSKGMKDSYFGELVLSHSYVTIPILKFDDTLFINTNSVNGIYVKDSLAVNDELKIIEKELKSKFDAETQNEITRKYKYGIIVISRGRFF